MVSIRAQDSDGKGRARRRLTKVVSLALGLAMFGTVGLSGTLAQDDAVATGGDAESIVNAIIAQVFAEIFGDAVVDDDAAVSGDLNMGGTTGSTVTMGGGGGGVTVGDDSGG